MHCRKRRQLRTEGSTLRCMWKSHRSPGVGGKSPKTWILLAHNAQRCNRTSQEMQNLSGARQNLSPPIRAVDASHKPLALSAVGVGHTGTFSHWNLPVKIYHRSSGLFHQMGRSRTFGYYHRTEDTQLRLAFHNMQVWYPESFGFRQWKAI